MENCLGSVGIGSDYIGRGSTGPKIIMERNTNSDEMHKAVLRVHFEVKLNIKNDKCGVPSLPEDKLL